ncbi:MAG: sulfite reductase subunit alpha [Opitutaceae bacterium]|jgi:sulfite reductase (NADPH) flavoprotein alpha-component|nr:sulfite reductase subunit alpha [Opitutaceae bacterium]
MQPATPAAAPFTKDNPRPVLMTSRSVLAQGSGKETLHIVFDIAGTGLTYNPGDALGVFATNPPRDIEEILHFLHATGDEPVSPAALKLPAPIPLREALASGLVLSGPTPKFLNLLASRLSDPWEKRRADDLLAVAASNKAALDEYLRSREYVDLFYAFRSADITPQEFVDHLRKLMPRLYSISSSQRLHPGEIHLTLSVVRYASNGRKRHGVCSTHLADRVVLNETPVKIFVAPSHFSPPADPATDIIMVGPGVGIAPFRGFVEDRAAQNAAGRDWLFFGDRSEAHDFLYRDEWEKWLAAGRLTKLSLAWSRDQPEKIYVQDRMREQGAELWQWLQNGAHFYVCGDAKRMAKDVDAALVEIVAAHGNLPPEQAAAYVKKMRAEGRYQRDVY